MTETSELLKTDLNSEPKLVDSTELKEVDSESETVTKPNVKNYNPKWDTIDESGNVVRDLNKYSDTEANKVEGSETEEQPDVKPVEVSPVDKTSFDFKTVWEDGSIETKQGTGSNMQNNSLLFTYSDTKPAQNLYVTVSNVDTHDIVNSNQSIKLGTLADGRSVYKIAHLNGASQVEFKSEFKARDFLSRKNGQTLTFEYKVYQNVSNDNNLDINALISTATELYSGKVEYVYEGLKQAGYTVTDKMTSVVETNVNSNNDFRRVSVSEHNKDTGELLSKLNKVSLVTGLNNAAYSKDVLYGYSAYESTSGYETPNHNNETLTVSGLPNGVTPVVSHTKLDDGSYKIRMIDLLNQPNATTTLDVTISDDLIKSIIEKDLRIKPEYKLERLNEDGTQFIQVVKDPYGFTLYSKGQSVGEEFLHNKVDPSGSVTSVNSKQDSGIFMSLVDKENHSHYPMFATYSYNGNGNGASTFIYNLTGLDAHFNTVKNVKATTVYAFTKGSWVEVFVNSEGTFNLPNETKRVALSYEKMDKGVRETPKFDVSLDSIDTFKTEFKDTRKFLDLEAQIFPNSDVVTFMEEEDIAKVSSLLADRLVLMNDEQWSHYIQPSLPRYELSREAKTERISFINKWTTNGPSNPSSDFPKEKPVDYFVHLTSDLMKLNPRFDDDVNIISETYVSNGVVYRVAPKNTNFTSFTLSIDSDGVTPVNGRVTVGTIDSYGSQFDLSTKKISESGSTYKVEGSNDTIDFGRDLKDNYVTTATANITYTPLREVFSKLSLVERDTKLTSNKDTIRNYDLIGSVVDPTGNSKPIKTATFGIPKSKGGTNFNLARIIDEIGFNTYSYELDNSGNFVDTITESDLSKVTRVRVTYLYPSNITATEPYVQKIPLVLDENSNSKKPAVGTLEFSYSDGSTLVTNNVDVTKDFDPLFEKEVLKFKYYKVGVENLKDDGSIITEPINPLYVPKNITTFKDYVKTHSDYKLVADTEWGEIYNSMFSFDKMTNLNILNSSAIISKVKTGTEGLVKLDTTKLFEYVYANLKSKLNSNRGVIREVLNPDDYYINDSTKYSDDWIKDSKSLLQLVTKVDSNGNETVLKPGELLNVSDIRELKVYYTLYTKLKSRGFVYHPNVDSPNKSERDSFADTYVYMASPYVEHDVVSLLNLLYDDDIEGLEPGKSVVVNHKELPSKTVVEENDRFKRTRIYSYTYHKLNDIDGFKDDGTRTIAYNGAGLGGDSHAVFFYDEHVDEKIEWKTKPLTVNYVDSETNKTLTSYTVQRLKDEAIGEFDQEYPNYTFERSDFNSTDLMGDSERTVNMYFKHKKATVRTEVYVDNTLVSTNDEEVNTLSKVDKKVSDLTLEHDGKVAKYVRTESDNDVVGEEGSVTTVKHYYETVAEIKDVAVNVVFKDGDTVVGSTLAESSKEGNNISWTVTSNVSDTIDINTYKPVKGDWTTTELKGTLSYDSNKKVYTVEVPVTKRVGRIIVKYVDETGSEIRTPEVYMDQPVGTKYDKVSPTTKLPTETGYVNKDGKLYMRTTGYVRVTKDDFGPGTISEGDNVFTFTYKKSTNDIEAKVTGKVPNDAPILDKDVKELIPEPHGTVYEADPSKPKGETEVVVEGSDGYTITSTSYTHDENGKIITTPNEPEVVKPVNRVVKVGTQPNVEVEKIPVTIRYVYNPNMDKDYRKVIDNGSEGELTTTTTYTVNEQTGDLSESKSTVETVKMIERVIEIGTKETYVPNDAPIHDKPDYEGGVVPNDAPVYEKPDYEGGVVPNDAPIHEKPEYEGGVVPNDAPIHEKPDYEGGVVPNDAPIYDKPDYEGGVVPNDAPIYDKPDYEGGVVPNDAPIYDKPDYEGGVVPNDAPIYDKPDYVENISPVKENVLPNTGGADSNILSLLGGLSLTSMLEFASRKRKED